MMIKLKQFVLREACSFCEVCCRYLEKDTVWAPLFLFDEILELTEKNILPSCLFTHAATDVRRPARINLVLGATHFICPCFNPQKNMCKIYEYRPLDCQLYPFLLVRRGKKVFLALDQKCPYTKNITATQAFKDYVEFLLGFFASEDFIQLIKKNPEFIQEYPQDVEILESLPYL
jgi:Fe-S-cluster containining protein